MNSKKTGKKLTYLSRAIVLLTIGFGIELFFSCTPKLKDPIEINYNNIRVESIDNSDRFINYHNEIDTVYSDALALKLTLTDTSRYYVSSFYLDLKQAFSFPTLKAEQRVQNYFPRNKVLSIKVKTIFDINDELKAGDDISNHLFYSSREHYELYKSLNHGISRLNGIQSHEMSSSINLVLKASIKNTKAQFEINVMLDNGKELLVTSQRITIIESVDN